ncbi:MAG TPA: FAD/NAD(P)-binding oxidoreductase [Pseudonocardia sp.]|nr:FAD/NAD(P)-binding oxidoreductase [Pseudonocardia sp.]
MGADGDLGGAVIVGASVGGLHAAEQLRARGFTGAITLVGAEPHLPYDRPPLSKQLLLGIRHRDDVMFRTRAELAELHVQLRLGSPAIHWDGQLLTLADGSALGAGRLIVSTGVLPRSLPGQPRHPAIGTLRTVDDAEWLAARLRRGGTVAVVGGGFIGAEVASAARALGNDVVMFEATDLPMQGVLGTDAGAIMAEVLTGAGVDYHGGTTVGALVPDGEKVLVGPAGTGVNQLRADTVVVGIGSIPQSAWLGLEGPGGVRCDEHGRALGLARTYAIGDVAAWPDPWTGQPRRSEHWTSTRHQAAAVAADIVGAEPPPPEPPYFWTDQFGLKIQVVGRPDLADRTVVSRPQEGGVKKSVVLYLANDRLVGVALFSAARHLGRFTGLIGAGADEASALAGLTS